MLGKILLILVHFYRLSEESSLCYIRYELKMNINLLIIRGEHHFLIRLLNTAKEFGPSTKKFSNFSGPTSKTFLKRKSKVSKERQF